MSQVHFKPRWTTGLFRKVTLKCDNCGAVFNRPISSRQGSHDFCTRKCSAQYHAANR